MIDCGDCRRDGCIAYCALELGAEPGWMPEPARLTLRRRPTKTVPIEEIERAFRPIPIPTMVRDHMRAEAEARAAGRKFTEYGIDINWPTGDPPR